MEAVKKVEIITSTLEIERVLDLLDRVGVSGYTVIKDLEGKGDRGIADGKIDKVFSNAYILTVCANNKQIDDLVTKVTPILKKVGGVCLVTDANWVSH
jgi:nitrogen regulatory protein PII